MSKWQFEPMGVVDARRILQTDDKSSDTYKDRVTAQRLLDRRFSDTGKSTPALASYRIPPKKKAGA